ncbi:olfactory receptor 6C3-like [Ranitomeya imitator]|uniref:olfactory receptor 6C3-like n=1 Tax=Ranitomeya imitator TaxID=111125 RepID=UPI0037E78757
MTISCSSHSCSLYPSNNLMNGTIVTEFVLLGFHLAPHLRIFVFYLIFICYTVTLMGNFIILYLVFSDQRLHFPMYYFLCNLAAMDIFFINTVVPGMLNGFVQETVHISLELCLTQSFIYFLIGTAEFLLFAVMSFDRYLAICRPLHYTIIMHRKMCIRLIAGVWLGSFFIIAFPSVLVCKLNFCNNLIDDFFCDSQPLLANSCTETTMIELLSVFGVCSLYISVLITIISYIKIVLEVLKIDSADGRVKTLSTCSSHAVVVTLIYSSCIFLYAKPSRDLAANFDKEVAILNTVVVPLLNPFIYTLRNQTVRRSFSDVFLMKNKK